MSAGSPKGICKSTVAGIIGAVGVEVLRFMGGSADVLFTGIVSNLTSAGLKDGASLLTRLGPLTTDRIGFSLPLTGGSDTTLECAAL